jgi:hypothetical protein
VSVGNRSHQIPGGGGGSGGSGDQDSLQNISFIQTPDAADSPGRLNPT